jgi:hypothetical protein
MERNNRWNYKWAIWSFVLCCQARSQAMNAVSAAASIAGAYTCTCVYTYIMQLYCICVLFMHKRKKCLCRNHKFDINYVIAWYRIFYLTFVGQCIVINFYSKTNQMHNTSNLFYFGTTLYMFRTVSPSIIRSLRLYIQHKVYVIQVLWLLGSNWPSETCRVLFQNKTILRYCGSGWFYYRNAYFMYEPITYRSLLALCANCICDFFTWIGFVILFLRRSLLISMCVFDVLRIGSGCRYL